MEGVVAHGTATNLRNADYKIAGKTGTAQIARDKHGYRTGSRMSYQASFVGYISLPKSTLLLYSGGKCPVERSVLRTLLQVRYSGRSPTKCTRPPSTGNTGLKTGMRLRSRLLRRATVTGEDIMRFLESLEVRYRRTSKEDWVATRENGGHNPPCRSQPEGRSCP